MIAASERHDCKILAAMRRPRRLPFHRMERAVRDRHA
jgi:hypothetical protein